MSDMAVTAGWEEQEAEWDGTGAEWDGTGGPSELGRVSVQAYTGGVRMKFGQNGFRIEFGTGQG